MNAPFQPALPPRTSFLTKLIILSERARRERIITLDRGRDYHEIPAAHVAAAAMKKDRM